MTEEEVFQDTSMLLKQAFIMLESRVKEIENMNTSQLTEPELVADAVISTFKSRSIQAYCYELKFLSDEILHTEPKRHFFALANCRKLIDIYSRFLHLQENCSDNSKRALTCIAYQLNTYKRIEDCKVYEDVIKINQEFLTHVGFTFPVFTDFNFDWYQKSKFMFASNRKLLDQETIDKYSNPPIKVFSGKKLVSLYGSISEICHGNPYFHSGTVFRERFWIATMALMMSSFLIDLLDVHTFKKTNRKDFRLWMSEVDKVSRSLINV